MQEDIIMTLPLDLPVHLAERELLNIRDGKGIEVRCLLGQLWITQAGDCEDIILQPGQSFVLDRQGLALVAALVGPAVVIFEPGEIVAPPQAAVYDPAP